MGTDNPFSYGSASWSKLGKDSPFAQSGFGNIDWGKQPGQEAWRGFTFDKGDSSDSSGKPKAADYLKAFAANAFGEGGGKYREKAESAGSGVRFGDAIGGGSGRVLDNLGVVMPSQHAPIFIPGVQQAKSNRGSQIGRLAGTVLGLGASALIPGVGPMVGASIGGGLGGGVGGFFD